MRQRCATLILMLFFIAPARSQEIDRDSFKEIDRHVSSLGAMRDRRLKEIVDSLTSPCREQSCMVRAIYFWVCNQITYDCQAFHHPKQVNNHPSTTLRDRTAICGGYASLFQTMCNIAHINCVTVSGLSKAHPAGIGKVTDKDRHSWNAVQIRDRWYLCDPAWGAGSTDRKVRTFSRSFTDAWFLSDRRIFALSHFPDDPKMQLLDTPVKKLQFTQAPVVEVSAMIYRILPEPGMRGAQRGRQDSSRTFRFTVLKPENIKSVSAMAGESMDAPVKWTLIGQQLEATVTFPLDGTYPLTLIVNGYPAYTYMATVSRRPRQIKRPAPAAAAVPAG